ncbi:hypothetical protein OH77DRAFT_356348 [Trametes cingulata]|nr:hypothetical protein OH77DRAFT_356348 [Trametes cingulata]
MFRALRGLEKRSTRVVGPPLPEDERRGRHGDGRELPGKADAEKRLSPGRPLRRPTPDMGRHPRGRGRRAVRLASGGGHSHQGARTVSGEETPNRTRASQSPPSTRLHRSPPSPAALDGLSGASAAAKTSPERRRGRRVGVRERGVVEADPSRDTGRDGDSGGRVGGRTRLNVICQSEKAWEASVVGDRWTCQNGDGHRGRGWAVVGQRRDMASRGRVEGLRRGPREEWRKSATSPSDRKNVHGLGGRDWEGGREECMGSEGTIERKVNVWMKLRYACCRQGLPERERGWFTEEHKLDDGGNVCLKQALHVVPSSISPSRRRAARPTLSREEEECLCSLQCVCSALLRMSKQVVYAAEDMF